MSHEEIDEILAEILAILQDTKVLERNKLSYEDVCSVPQFSTAILLYYYWGLAPVDTDLLRFALYYATDDDFKYMNDKISERWLKNAHNEIAEVINEIENSSDR